MLRAVLLIVALACAAIGLVLCSMHVPAPGVHLLGFGVVMVMGLLFERWRYRAHYKGPKSGWKSTPERFEDPETGRVLGVQYHPQSGERRYIAEDSTADSVSFDAIN